jgi:hypothetical protein
MQLGKSLTGSTESAGAKCHAEIVQHSLLDIVLSIIVVFLGLWCVFHVPAIMHAKVRHQPFGR